MPPKPLLAVALTLALAVTPLIAAPAQNSTQDRAPQPSALGGRYVIIISPHQNASTYLLDTLTGRVWTPVKYTGLEGEPVIWSPMERVDTKAELLEKFGPTKTKQ